MSSSREEIAQRYRAQVAIAHSRLKTIGLPPETVRERASRADLRLSELFIPLRLVPERDVAAPEDLARVLTRCRSNVVLGDPGMGKSTLLAYLALLFAGGASLDGFSPAPTTLPLFISLRDLVRLQRDKPDLSFLEYLETHARRHLQVQEAHGAFFEASLRMGEAVVLLDGLDEVGSEAARHRVATAIRAFRAQFPDCPFWVTSRVYGYTSSVRLSGEGFAHYRIGRLDDAQVNGFIDRWYALQIPDDPAERTARAAALREAVHRTPSVRRLAHNPLLLTLMAFIHHGLRKLPQDRGELYEKCVEMLLKTWQEARRDDTAAPHAIGDLKLHVQTQKDYLAHLAFFVQEKKQHGEDEEARGLFSRGEALDCLGARHWERAVRDRPALTRGEAREEMGRFLEYIGEETGLLIDRGGDQLSFIHLSFQEYLAAWVFTCGSDTPGGAAFFEQHLGDPAWEEVLLLRLYIVLRAPGGGGTDEFDRIIARILRRLEEKSSPEGWLTLVRALRDDLEFTDTNRKLILTKALGFWLEAPELLRTWFRALEEVRLFAERARGVLREVLAEARAREPMQAIACLHLETKLFGFPAEAVGELRKWADLPEMLPDLVAFLGEPGVDALLAERATVDHFSTALSALDGPALYRRTLQWASAPLSEAALSAGLRLLWGKSLAEHRSRSAFAASRRGSDAAVLFDRPGSVMGETPLFSATLPLSGVRALRATLPGGDVLPRGRLLVEPLAKKRLDEAGEADCGKELIAWAEMFIRTQLQRFPTKEAPKPALARDLAVTFGHDFGSDFDRGFVRDFVHDFVRDFGRGFVRYFGRDFVRDFGRGFVRSFVRDFGRDFVRSFGRDFVRDFGRGFVRYFGRYFVRDFGRGFVRSFVRDFGRDFVRSFGRDFVRSFGRDFVRYFGRDFGVDPEKPGWEADWDRAMEDEGNQRRLLQHDTFWWWSYYRAGQISIDSDKPATTLTLRLESPLVLPFLLVAVWSAAANQHVFAMCRHLAERHPGGKIPDEVIDGWLDQNPIEVYAVALAWEEHIKTFTTHHNSLTGPEGALFIAHAAYATLMTGLPCPLPYEPDLTDPHVRISHTLYELCNFRDADISVLEGIFTYAPEVKSTTQPASPPPKPQVDKPSPLFAWLHLSDLQIGHKNAAWDQSLVRDVLRKDILAQISQGLPAPQALLITGDIAHSGAEDEYKIATKWLLDLAADLHLDKTRIYLVPGNHDIDRTADKTKRALARLLEGLREGREDLDTILADADESPLLLRRLTPYLTFASTFPSIAHPDPLAWSHHFIAHSGLRLRLIGLNTALLSADDLDKGKLRLGKAALAKTLTNLPDNELLLVLTHHPMRDGWLADQRDADAWIKGHAHVHLFGHVHEADSEETRAGAGTSLIRIAAGAAYDAGHPGVPQSHGYSFAAVFPADDGTLRLRVWPRRWSDKLKTFTMDPDNTTPNRPYAEHTLPGLRQALVMAPRPATTRENPG